MSIGTPFRHTSGVLVGGTLGVVLTAVILIIVASMTPIRRGAVAEGHFERTGEHNIIQQPDGGVVENILVKEGDLVAPGQTLVQLDDRTDRIALQLLEEQERLLLIEQAELQAERVGRTQLELPNEVVRHASDPSTERAVETAKNLLFTRKMSRDQRKAVLRDENARLQSHAEGLKAQKAALLEQVRLTDIEAESLSDLYKKGLTTRTQVLALQRSAADLRGSVGAVEAGVRQDALQIGQNGIRILAVDQDMQEEDAKRLAELQSNLSELQDKAASQRLTLQRTRVVAPFSGIVLNRSVNSPGMVVRPGEPIMEIVRNDELLVKADVRPQDIERVRIGANATVVLPALNTPAETRLKGKVTYVSADALSDKNRRASYYEAEVDVPATELRKLSTINLRPGMPTEVIIDAGTRTMLSYLLQPVVGAFGHAPGG